VGADKAKGEGIGKNAARVRVLVVLFRPRSKKALDVYPTALSSTSITNFG
jgi:hypothetical protein